MNEKTVPKDSVWYVDRWVVGLKLVRDKMPENWNKEKYGEHPKFGIADDEQFGALLKKKLLEEVAEYSAKGELEELVDALELIYAISANEGVTPKELERMRLEKREKKGGFDGRLTWEGQQK